MTVVNLTAITGRDVFTRNGKYVGKVDDSMIDTEKGNLYGITINMARESFLYKLLSSSEQGVKKTILIPYREVLACDDIIIVTVPKQYEKPETETTETASEPEAILPGVGETE